MRFIIKTILILVGLAAIAGVGILFVKKYGLLDARIAFISTDLNFSVNFLVASVLCLTIYLISRLIGLLFGSFSLLGKLISGSLNSRYKSKISSAIFHENTNEIITAYTNANNDPLLEAKQKLTTASLQSVYGYKEYPILVAKLAISEARHLSVNETRDLVRFVEKNYTDFGFDVLVSSIKAGILDYANIIDILNKYSDRLDDVSESSLITIANFAKGDNDIIKVWERLPTTIKKQPSIVRNFFYELYDKDPKQAEKFLNLCKKTLAPHQLHQSTLSQLSGYLEHK